LTGTLYGLTNSDVEFTKVQFELKPYATPFVSGTRGTTVATGGGWADVSGNGNNGGLVNGPTYDSSNLGSLVFDGVDDTVNIANAPNTQFSHTSPWSIIITYKLISQNNSVPGIIRKGSAGAGGSGIIIFYFTGGGVWWKHFNSQTQFTTIDLGVTKQIAFTYGGSGNVNAYVNGVFATTVGTMSDTETSSALELGRADQYGNINIYQFLKYDRQLSANEILQNFNAQRSRFGL
jgi:hypothetical protein